MHLKLAFLIILILQINAVLLQNQLDPAENVKDTSSDSLPKPGVLSPKIYSNIFVRRREEHKLLLKHLMGIDNYEKKYKMLDIALKQIVKVVEENKFVIFTAKLENTTEFPKNQSLVEAISLIIENTSLFGDLILHLPQMSYKILKKLQWRKDLNWALQYASVNFQNLIDEQTLKMLDLFNQEINEDQRTEDYVNPYYENFAKPEKKNQKAKKKLKRGPQMSRNEL